jgi:uncharacterized phiE125 gp8 family phage protein
MTLTLITAPTQAPVSATELRDHLRITDLGEEAYVSTLAAAAVSYLDGWGGVLGRAIMPQVWRQEFDGWGRLQLDLPDVTAIAVTYEDSLGAEQPAASATLRKMGSAWYVDAEGPGAERVFVNMTCALPAVRLPTVQAVIKLLVAHWYQNREAAGAAMVEAPMSADALITALRYRAI